MTKAVGADAIMSAAELKPLLLLSKHGPISCAIGMTKDKHGVIFLDKKGKPRKAMAELRKAAAGASVEVEASSLRFGRAHVNAEADGNLVHLIVNKEAPVALRPKLVEHLKKAGFGRCEITVDTALDKEGEEDGAGPAHEHGQHHAANPDPAALTHKLTTLVKAMVGLGLHGPELDGMKAAAVAAQGALKAGHPATAEKDIAQLEHLVRAHAQARHAVPAAHVSAAQAPVAQAHVTATGRPSLHSKSGQEFEAFKNLDAAQHDPGAKVMMGGETVPVARAVQEMHDKLHHAQVFARHLNLEYKEEADQSPRVKLYYDKCNEALGGTAGALSAKPPQLAAAYGHLQTAYLAFDDLQSEVSAQHGLAEDKWSACMEAAKEVRHAACTATVVLASVTFGKAGNTVASVLTHALEAGSDAAAGEKVDLTKVGAETILDVVLGSTKMGDALTHAVEHRIAKWTMVNIGKHFRAAAGSDAFKAIEEFMTRNGHHLPPGTEAYWAKFGKLMESPKLSKEFAKAAAEELLGDSKSILAASIGAVIPRGEHPASDFATAVRGYVADLQNGKHLREETIPTLFSRVAAKVLKHN